MVFRVTLTSPKWFIKVDVIVEVVMFTICSEKHLQTNMTGTGKYKGWNGTELERNQLTRAHALCKIAV